MRVQDQEVANPGENYVAPFWSNPRCKLGSKAVYDSRIQFASNESNLVPRNLDPESISKVGLRLHYFDICNLISYRTSVSCFGHTSEKKRALQIHTRVFFWKKCTKSAISWGKKSWIRQLYTIGYKSSPENIPSFLKCSTFLSDLLPNLANSSCRGSQSNYLTKLNKTATE
jgi:hypothetical protein